MGTKGSKLAQHGDSRRGEPEKNFDGGEAVNSERVHYTDCCARES